MSLLQDLKDWDSYNYVITLNAPKCEYMARLAKLKNYTYRQYQNPGEKLLHNLHNAGISVKKFLSYIKQLKEIEKKINFNKFLPSIKVAILIGNAYYQINRKLPTPVMNCYDLAKLFHEIGFVVVLITDTKTEDFKAIFYKIMKTIPIQAYCVIYYGGHGFEMNGVNYMLGVESPEENITFDHCISENFILSEVSKRKPELCVMLLDKCRSYLNIEKNPLLYEQTQIIEPYNFIGSLIVAYCTQSGLEAKERVEVDTTRTVSFFETNLISKVIQGKSYYVGALKKFLTMDLEVNEMLDRVHEDQEELKEQIPSKRADECSGKRLTDKITDSKEEFQKTLEGAINKLSHLKDFVKVYSRDEKQ